MSRAELNTDIVSPNQAPLTVQSDNLDPNEKVTKAYLDKIARSQDKMMEHDKKFRYSLVVSALILVSAIALTILAAPAIGVELAIAGVMELTIAGITCIYTVGVAILIGVPYHYNNNSYYYQCLRNRDTNGLIAHISQKQNLTAPVNIQAQAYLDNHPVFKNHAARQLLEPAE